MYKNPVGTLENCDTNFNSGLVCFANVHKNRDFTIVFHDWKFSSKCPVTENYDYAEVKITYNPDERCIELMSLRKYLREFHGRSISHESTAHKILKDIMEACAPSLCKVEILWEVVDGTRTSILVTDMNWRNPSDKKTSKD